MVLFGNATVNTPDPLVVPVAPRSVGAEAELMSEISNERQCRLLKLACGVESDGLATNVTVTAGCTV